MASKLLDVVMFVFSQGYRFARTGWLRLRFLGVSWLIPWKSSRRIDLLAPVLLEMWHDQSVGDAHFARAMRRELEDLGFRVRIVPYQLWHVATNARYVVQLRGMLAHKVCRRRGVKYLMWVISHPDLLTKEECDSYDYVAFASRRLAERFSKITSARVGVLLQATDAVSMNKEFDVKKPCEALFIGNTRGVYRDVIKNLLPTKCDLVIYGGGWEKTPAAKYVVAKSIEYEKVGSVYRSAKIVLNDHWQAMAENGIVSNRCFDVLAAGGFVVSDYVPEIDVIFKGTIPMFKTREELLSHVDYYLRNDELRRRLAQQGREVVLTHHTFKVRMNEMVNVLLAL